MAPHPGVARHAPTRVLPLPTRGGTTTEVRSLFLRLSKVSRFCVLELKILGSFSSLHSPHDQRWHGLLRGRPGIFLDFSYT